MPDRRVHVHDKERHAIHAHQIGDLNDVQIAILAIPQQSHGKPDMK